jgi:hypothetical protein
MDGDGDTSGVVSVGEDEGVLAGPLAAGDDDAGGAGDEGEADAAGGAGELDADTFAVGLGTGVLDAMTCTVSSLNGEARLADWLTNAVVSPPAVVPHERNEPDRVL